MATSLIREGQDQLRIGFANVPWQVHKFGGTSVANAECYKRVAKIVEEQLVQYTSVSSVRTSDTCTSSDSNKAPVGQTAIAAECNALSSLKDCHKNNDGRSDVSKSNEDKSNIETMDVSYSVGMGTGIDDEDADGCRDEDSCATESDKPRKMKVRLAVVVSAIGGKPKTTDLLLDSVKYAAERDTEKVESVLSTILEKHRVCLEGLNCATEIDLTTELQSTKSNIQVTADETNRRWDENDNKNEKHEGDVTKRLMRIIEKDLNDIRDILKTVSLMKWQAERISELISGYGELWSAQILTTLLNCRRRTNANIEHCNASVTDSAEFVYLDARRVITIDEDATQNGGAVVWEVSQTKLQQVYEEEIERRCRTHPNTNDSHKKTKRNDPIIHFVMTGYVAVNTHGVSTTLQRDGSDYSASIIGRLLSANSVSIWTDVDGVLSADPRRVPLAHVLPEVSYQEAMELAYFGAKVIHPKTMQPAIQSQPQIPIYIRNTFNSTFRGSRIFTSSGSTTNREQVVCGFSSIEHMAIINVEGTGMVGVLGVSRRLFGALEHAGVNIVLISQASSEHSVTFATTHAQATIAKTALEQEFRRELDLNQISNIDVKAPCSIIAAVGDGMARTAGCSARFFSALGDAQINVIAIAQGCSERNISAVVKMEDSSRALRAVHAAFRLSHTTIRIGLIGMNGLGSSLLSLMETQRTILRSTFDIDLQVCAVLPMIDENDDRIVCLKNDLDGGTDSIAVGSYTSASGFGKSNTSFIDDSCAKQIKGGIPHLLNILLRSECTNHVIFDCTNSKSVSQYHAKWLQATIDVVTANNTGLSGSKEQRDTIIAAERIYGKESAKYLREVTVGGGLPVIKTLRSLLHTGDQIRRIDGILSVSLSYIMFRISPPQGAALSTQYDAEYSNGAFTGDLIPPTSSSPDVEGNNNIIDAENYNATNDICSFSEAVREAVALGLMEEDIDTDFNNEYTCRVLMVLARELGMDEGIETLQLQKQSEKLLDVIMGRSNVKYLDAKKECDIRVQERVQAARSRGCVLRHVASIDVRSRKLDVKIVEVPDHHIFAVTPPSCACFRFFTKRHATYPLIIQGPSAGVDSTASALLAELIHLMRGKTSPISNSLSRTGSGAHLKLSTLEEITTAS